MILLACAFYQFKISIVTFKTTKIHTQHNTTNTTQERYQRAN